MIYRLIPAKWMPEDKYPLEGVYSDEQLLDLNAEGYNVYYFPNYPSNPTKKYVDGAQVDTFNWVFVDLDMKDYKSSDPKRSHDYATKADFIAALYSFPLLPTKVVDSGGGIHAYWQISDLSAMDFLKLQRRLARHFKTDPEVSKLSQLMRMPGYVNTKIQDEPRLCEILAEEDRIYSCEDLDNVLEPITTEDSTYVQAHYNKTHDLESKTKKIDDMMPPKFYELIASSKEASDIWSGNLEDRSKGDFRLGHLMRAAGFTVEEAMSVLVNSSKAVTRAPQHRIGYAEGIVAQIWPKPEDMTKKQAKKLVFLSSSVQDILMKSASEVPKDTRFMCSTIVDATDAGFKLGQVFGLVGGSGSGKTTFALNLFRWFTELNPDYVHFFVSLEQSEIEIARRWQTMCGANKSLHSKVQILGNYNEDGTYRHLSLKEIKDYILQFEKETGKKVGCVVLDHIGCLRKESKHGETQALIDICHKLKSFAMETNTFFVVQSQSNREKAGIGDLELNKDAAFGTTAFEWYCDFLLTIWAPLKRVYDRAPHMTVTAFKYCKIREKNIKKDKIQEDQRYMVLFDPETERFRPLNQTELTAFDHFNTEATNMRKADRKTDVLPYNSVTWVKDDKAS